MQSPAQHDNYKDLDEGSFIDERDGQEYDWVRIGTQIWMRQNLNIANAIYVVHGEIVEHPFEKLCYDDKEENCKKYGGLYPNWIIENYTTSEGARSICPEGWHLPAEIEWITLFNHLGSYEVAGGTLKESGISNWKRPNKGGTNSSHFTALPAGYCQCGKEEYVYADIRGIACFWSSTEIFYLPASSQEFKTICLTRYNAGIAHDRSVGNSAHSVRCVKDRW
jgi:uncharacterized protein (TIGR02145 family)